MTSAPHRHSFRFSLRTLFILVTLSALVSPAIPTLVARYRQWQSDRAWANVGGRGTIAPFRNNLCDWSEETPQ